MPNILNIYFSNYEICNYRVSWVSANRVTMFKLATYV